MGYTRSQEMQRDMFNKPVAINNAFYQKRISRQSNEVSDNQFHSDKMSVQGFFKSANKTPFD